MSRMIPIQALGHLPVDARKTAVRDGIFLHHKSISALKFLSQAHFCVFLLRDFIKGSTPVSILGLFPLSSATWQ